jgi:3-oxoadipate enol-lactonase
VPKAKVNGIDLYYEIQGEGAPVLLIAGFTADHLAWFLQVPALAREFQVITFDNRGAGQSGQPEGPYTIRQLADDAAGLLDHLGITRAHVVGHSMGGAIAQEFGINHPHRTASLAILGSWARGDERTARFLDLWRHARERFEPEHYLEFTCQACFTHRFYNIPGAVDMVKMQALGNPFPQSLTGFLAQYEACKGHDSLDRLEQIKAPTLVMAATEDAILPPRFSREIARRIPGAAYEELADCGHLFTFEQTELTNDRLLHWLRGVSR